MESSTGSALVLDQSGYCPICAHQVRFTARSAWFRDHLLCGSCGSIPRERALLVALEMYYPGWRSLAIHESSPIDRGTSPKLAREAREYVATQFYPHRARGTYDRAGIRCEDLERQTFAAGSFDLVITQDVFEHLFRPDLAIREIARTLRPGGAHVCSVPITRKHAPSVRRAWRQGDGTIVHFAEPQYHGNPVSGDGALVTIEWGYDICGYLARHSGLDVAMVVIDNLDLGIRADLIEILVCCKPPSVPSIDVPSD